MQYNGRRALALRVQPACYGVCVEPLRASARYNIGVRCNEL
jgi:hypothetical protein